MTDASLIRDFMEVEQLGEATILKVAVVEWPGPHSPELNWRTVRSWRGSPGPVELAVAKHMVLVNRKFFQRCNRCGERNNAGHMSDGHTCQSCAERYLGVVF